MNILRDIGGQPLFDQDWYLECNPDVAESAIDPLDHFMNNGWREGRDPNPMFDISYYLESYPDVAAAGVNPVMHFISFGTQEGRNPHPAFNTTWYKTQHATALASGENPLVHYLTEGRPKGFPAAPGARAPLRAPSAPPSSAWHDVTSHADVREATIDVVIPVYRGYDDTLACIYSVLANAQQTEFELVVINDASPDSRLSAQLASLSRQRLFTYLINRRNLGFVQSANRGLTLHSNRDVVLLNSDTMVFGDWLDRLIAHVQSDPSIATITPFSNNATICSYPETNAVNKFELEVPLQQIDLLAARCNAGSHTDVPTGVGFCLFMRRHVMETIGYFDAHTFGQGYGEENDFCMRAANAGFKNVLAHDVFVYHAGGLSFSEEAAARSDQAQIILDEKHPSYRAKVRDYINSDPARVARVRLDATRLSTALENPPIVFITHSWGGGIDRHIGDLQDQLFREAVSTVVLRVGTENFHTLRVELPHQAKHLSLPNVEEFDIELEAPKIAEFLRALSPQQIHVHSVVGLRRQSVISLFQAIGDSGVPYRYTWHDFSPLCHRNQFVDPTRRYCEEPAAIEVCRRCLSNDPDAIDEFDPAERHEVFKAFLDGATCSLVPSQSTADRAQRLVDRDNVNIVPHKEIFDPANWIQSPPLELSPLRVAVVGAIGPHKGSDILYELLRDAEFRRLPLEYTLIGYSDRPEMLLFPNFKTTGKYASDSEAIRQLKILQPHFSLLPSIWPETYCYTLSIAFETGIPPIVFDIGAQAERVISAGWGHVLPLSIARNSSELNDQILKLSVQQSWAARKRMY